jgi:hypothetical protein
VAYYHAPTNTKHVVYREANDHLYDIQWVPNSGTAPQRIDLTLMALADRAAGKPAAFLGLGTISTSSTAAPATRSTRS